MQIFCQRASLKFSFAIQYCMPRVNFVYIKPENSDSKFHTGPVELRGRPYFLADDAPINAIVHELMEAQLQHTSELGIYARIRDGVLVENYRLRSRKIAMSRIDGTYSKQELTEMVKEVYNKRQAGARS
jgi:hypothetical protein